MQVMEGSELLERLEVQREVIEMQADVLEALGFDLIDVVERETPPPKRGRISFFGVTSLSTVYVIGHMFIERNVSTYALAAHLVRLLV